MKITKKSDISGKTHTLDLPITSEEFEKCFKKYKEGALIQHAFPMLSSEHREFLLTGVTQEEWDEVFGKEE